MTSDKRDIANAPPELAKEMEVTPEMLRAGASVLCGFDITTADEAYWAKRVYLAMTRARLSRDDHA